MKPSRLLIALHLRRTWCGLALLLVAGCGVVTSSTVDGGRGDAPARDAGVRADVTTSHDAVREVASGGDAVAADGTKRRDAPGDAVARRDASLPDSTTSRDVAATDVTTHHDAPSDTTTHHDAPADATRADVFRTDATQREASAPDVALCAPPRTWCGASCVDEQSDVHHCGGCNTDCTALAHVNPELTTCQGGVCALSCAPGYADCNDAGAGCTARLASPVTCGSCATVCPPDTPLCWPVVADGGAEGGSPDAGFGCTSGCTPPTDVRCGGFCVDQQTDVDNCGACGLFCPGTCALGHCVEVVMSLPDGGTSGSAVAIALSATHVYALTESPSAVLSVGLDGGTPITLAQDDALYVEDIAIDSNFAYWDESVGAPEVGVIKRVALDGGAVTTLATQPGGAFSLAVNDAGIYWTGDELLRMNLDGSDVVTFATTDFPERLTVNSTAVFWLGLDGVYKADLNGANIVTLVNTPIYGDGYLAINDDSVLYNIGVTVQSVPIGGGAVTVLATWPDLTVLAADDQNVYWTAGEEILRMPISGGAVTTLASGQGYPLSLAVDSTSLYWGTSAGPGTVMKVTPK
jgi:hypothetical protein